MKKRVIGVDNGQQHIGWYKGCAIFKRKLVDRRIYAVIGRYTKAEHSLPALRSAKDANEWIDKQINCGSAEGSWV